MSFKENLREAIDFNGIEQKELARKADISLRNIENYLRENASIPSAENAVRIAQVLGVSVEYLVTGKEIKQKSIHYSGEIKMALEIITQMEEKNRKMAITIIKSMKKLEDEEKAVQKKTPDGDAQ
jgi:transcriptional regulator with XRE-family HTH domain